MKKITLFALLAVLGFTLYAFAGSSQAPAVGGKNVSLTVPKVSKSDCKNLAAGKAGTATFDVSATSMVNVDSFNSNTDATAANLKRFWNTNTNYMPVRGAAYNIPVEAGATSLVFGKYSAANNSGTPRVCVEMN